MKKFKLTKEQKKFYENMRGFDIRIPFPDMETFDKWLHFQNKLCWKLLNEGNLPPNSK